MILSVSWRNIWRNKLRSIVVLIGIAIGVFAGVFIWAFYAGMVDQRINTAIKTEASHIQIHHPSYVKDPDVKFNIPNVHEKCDSILELEGVSAVSSRTILNSMIMSAETGSGVRIIGVDPDREKQVTDLYQKVIEGKYFDGVKRNPILIGNELAEKLNVKLHSKVVITLQQMNGTITRAQFRVVGIYKTSNSMYDGMNVFVRNSDIKQIINLEEDRAQEIAILLDNNSLLDTKVNELKSMFKNYDVKSWREIMPEVSLVEETMDISMFIFMGIILVALLFAIINTMLMAVLERIKELGMLMAIGMNKTRVFMMIVMETLFLAITGGILGIIIGVIFTIITFNTGIDLSAWSKAYASMGYDSVVYPVLNIGIFINITFMVIVTGMIGSIYPAIKALKFKPAEALRIDV